MYDAGSVISGGLDCHIADVRRYTSLNADQILHIYTDGLSGTSPDRVLEHWWPLAEGPSGTKQPYIFDVETADSGKILDGGTDDFWTAGQNNYHYNIKYGFEAYTSGTEIARVPIRPNNILITPDISASGFTKSVDIEAATNR